MGTTDDLFGFYVPNDEGEVLITDTDGLAAMVINLTDAQRAEFIGGLDPNGYHVVTFHMIHNDGPELRTRWLVKMKDSNEPRGLVLDCDADQFMAHTVRLQEVTR